MVHAEGSTEAIEAARRRSLLLKMLKRAAIDKDIVDDVADACEIKEYTVLHLASEELSADAVAQELYLTEEESKRVQNVCKQELVSLGVVLVEGGSLDPPLEDDEVVGRGASPQSPPDRDITMKLFKSEEEPVTDPPPASEEEGRLDSSEARETEDVAAPATPGAAGLEEEGDAAVAAADNAVSVDMSVEEALASAAEQLNIAAQDPMDPSAEVAETSDVSTPFPTDPESGKPVSRPQRPQSAPPKPLQPKPVEPAANVPSYMRATTAAKQKVKEDEAFGQLASAKTRPTSASVAISPSLLRPTAASKAWSSGKSPHVKARMGVTTNLDGHGTPSPKPQPTTPKPFNLSSTTARTGMSTEEMGVEQAKAQMKALNEKRKKLARVMSAPPKSRPQSERPTTQFKPFSLSSVHLHEKAVSNLEKQTLEEKKREEAARKFKARPVSYNKARTYTDVRSSVEENLKKEKKLTVAKEPVFHSQQRMIEHKRIEEEKKAREAEQMAADAEERQKLEKQKAKELKEMRRNLQFHAQEMPNFESPWKPDLSMSTPPTKAVAPVFECDKRLGAARKSVEGLDNTPLGVASADNLAFFASTLRSPACDVSAKKGMRDLRVEVQAHY